jgi:hypothetical protein
MQAKEVFSIDGETFDIGLVSVKRDAPVLDKYANRTEDGDLNREIIGVYFNYTLTFPRLHLDPSEYARLYDKVTEPVEFHTVVVPGTIGSFTFQAYITGVSDELLKIGNSSINYWGNLQIKFIAKTPSRS